MALVHISPKTRLVVLAMGLGVGRAILSLEADGLVNDEVAHARVTGGANGEADDDTYSRR